MTDISYDPRYLKGIRLFNQGEFFDCHHDWEELWIAESGPARSFYKGIIQAAVALHHLMHGNLRGANQLLAGAQRHLQPYRPVYLGLEIDKLLSGVSRCIATAATAAARGGDFVTDPASLPKIGLLPTVRT